MKFVQKIVLVAGTVVGTIFLTLYLFGFFNFLIFSYNFITAVD